MVAFTIGRHVPDQWRFMNRAWELPFIVLNPRFAAHEDKCYGALMNTLSGRSYLFSWTGFDECTLSGHDAIVFIGKILSHAGERLCEDILLGEAA